MWRQLGFGRRTWLAYLLIPRLFFGTYFLAAGLDKLWSGWLGRPVAVAQPTARPVLAVILDQFAHSNPYPFYKRFLLQIVIPRAAKWRYLIVFGEMAIGLSLVTGTLTRVGALFGVVANSNYLFMKGLRNPAAGVDQAFIVGLVLTLLGNPGRTLGGDVLLRHLWRDYPFW